MQVVDIRTQYGDLFSQRMNDPWKVSPPKGETASQVKQRVLEAIEFIHQLFPGEKVAIVTHGFVIAILRVYFQDQPIQNVWELVPAHCTPVSIIVP
jgi:broad specificity phosphatase PhoE